MATYLWVKLIHVVSATILFGTGLGTAFFMLRAYLSDNVEAMTVTARHVVSADLLFTTPAVVVQLGTGLWLTQFLGIAWDSPWFIAVISLFVFVGLCWIPVVAIQIRIRNLLTAGQPRHRLIGLMRWWIGLGIPAFLAVLVIFYMMISKVGAYR